MKIEDYMLPCLTKKVFGFDCPGCGLQRSVAHIGRGEFIDAFTMYPAIYTILLFCLLIGYNFLSKKSINSKIIYSLGIVNIIIILTNFFLKLI